MPFILFWEKTLDFCACRLVDSREFLSVFLASLRLFVAGPILMYAVIVDKKCHRCIVALFEKYSKELFIICATLDDILGPKLSDRIIF